MSGARLALVTALLAGKSRGSLLLRIDNPFVENAIPPYEKAILEDLEWLGLTFDEGPYRRSERLPLYLEAFEQLKSDQKLKFGGLMSREKIPSDLFASVVDDGLMEIDTIVCGDEDPAEIEAQKALFEALGFKVPQFIKLPPFSGNDGKPLSRQNGDIPIRRLREEGILPQSILNYVASLGVSKGENSDLLSPAELKTRFSIDHMAAAIFDLALLKHFNDIQVERLRGEYYYGDLEAPEAKGDWTPRVQSEKSVTSSDCVVLPFLPKKNKIAEPTEGDEDPDPPRVA